MNRGQIFLILNNIRSCENVGSIFRTADAVGIKKIFLCGYTPQPKSFQYQGGSSKYYGKDKIAKTALGAEKYIAWEHWSQAYRLLGKLKKDKINIVALEQTKDAADIFSAEVGSAFERKFKPKFPLALVVGNEVKGLSSHILKHCDEKVFIPMYGKKESLNVAVAVGVAVYYLKIKTWTKLQII